MQKPLKNTRKQQAQRLLVRDLLTLPPFEYHTTWEAMRRFNQQRQSQSCDEIWLLQHQPVYTLGRAGDIQHLLGNPQQIPVVRSDRGGQITYHGPGQWMIYTLLDLRRLQLGIRSLVTALEQAIVAVCASYQLEAYALPEAPGVYVQGNKLCAIGLRVSNGCCYHGLACNIQLDLAPFQQINACGDHSLQAIDWHRLCPTPAASDADANQETPATSGAVTGKSITLAQTVWKQRLLLQLQRHLGYSGIHISEQLPEVLKLAVAEDIPSI